MEKGRMGCGFVYEMMAPRKWGSRHGKEGATVLI